MNIWTLLVWGAALVVIGYYYIVTYLRKGVTLLMWTMLFIAVLPLLFFPFAFSEQNYRSVGENFGLIYNNLNKALLLFVLSLGLFAVGIIYGQKNILFYGQRRVTRVFLDTFFNESAIRVFSVISTLYFLLLVLIGVPLGAGIQTSFAHPELRPLLNVWGPLVVTTLTLSVTIALSKPTFLNWACVLWALAISLLTGQRGQSLLPLAGGVMYWLIAYRPKKILGPLLMVPVLFLASMAIYIVRNRDAVTGQIPTASFIQYAADQSLYGNQFSDVRDFAWILGGFDGQYLHGKTYLAGYTPFLPSFISPFRLHYGWGRWSTMTANLNPLEHAGLRPGFFGEVYFNFGIVGYIVICPIFGFVVGSILCNLNKMYAEMRPYQRAGANYFSASLITIATSFVFTTNFYNSIVLVAIFGTGMLVKWVVGLGRAGARRSLGEIYSGRLASTAPDRRSASTNLEGLPE